MYADMQRYLDELAAHGATVIAATDDPLMRFGGALFGDPVHVRILYLGLFPATAEPDSFAVPRKAKMSFT